MILDGREYGLVLMHKGFSIYTLNEANPKVDDLGYVVKITTYYERFDNIGDACKSIDIWGKVE